MNKVVATILISIFFTIGIVCFVLGIKMTVDLNQKVKDYNTVDGYFIDYEIFNPDAKEENPTYRLIYTYQVDSKDYKIKTDYGTSIIPEKKSVKEIKYNPNNPEEAIITGVNSYNFMIYFGAFFLMTSIFFIIGILTNKGVFAKYKIDVASTYISAMIFIIGIGIMIFFLNLAGSFQNLLKDIGIWLFVPVLFIITGLYCFIINIILRRKKN